MRDKKGPVNKRVDFLSNKLNKYSIRKFTIGTVLIQWAHECIWNSTRGRSS